MIGLAATPSFATTPTWSVTPGGSFTGTQSGSFTLADTTTGNSIVCTHTKAAGTLKTGTRLSGTGIGSITSISFTSCTGLGGLTLTISTRGLPWTLNADTYNGALDGGTTTGTLNGIHVKITGTGCSATVNGSSVSATDGQTQIHFHNSLSKLKIRDTASNLHFYKVTGCGSMIANGDAVTFSSAYRVSPGQTITSP